MKAIVLSIVCSFSLLLVGCGTEPTTTTPKVSTEMPRITGGMCPDDLQRCPDGTAVSRDSENGCQFFACPVGKAK